jgi:hypothetical protein
MTQRPKTQLCECGCGQDAGYYKHNPKKPKRFIKGHSARLLYLGKTLSGDHRENISKGLQGHEFSDETRAKISDALKGREFSPEHRQKISASQKGKTLGRRFPGKGTNYGHFHRRVRAARAKSGICEHCGAAPESGTHFALIHGRGQRVPHGDSWAFASEDPSDYIELCPSCHTKYDKKGGD